MVMVLMLPVSQRHPVEERGGSREERRRSSHPASDDDSWVAVASCEDGTALFIAAEGNCVTIKAA